MKQEYVQFTGSIPEHYERGLGPHIFIDYGLDLARRVAVMQPRKLLEIAAGTGIVTSLLRDALAGSAQITATDLNPAMLEIAQGKIGEDSNIDLKPADATDLPFDDAVFDVAVCQFGVMFFPDKDAAYREVYRTLTPGGRYLFNVWNSLDTNPFARIARDTVASFFPEEPPGFYNIPFGYHQLEAIKASLSATGFDNVETEVLSIEKEIPDAEVFARGIVYGNPAIEEIRALENVDPEDVMLAVAEEYRSEFGNNPGRMSLQAIVICATKPE